MAPFVYFEKACRTRRTRSRGLPHLGNVLRKAGDFGGAIRVFREGGRVHPDDLELRNNLGLALIEVRDFEAAIAEYQGLLSRYPDYLPAKKNLGLAFIQAGDARAAEKIYRQILESGGSDPIAEYNLAIAVREQDRLQEAVGHFRRAVELKPDFRDAHLELGKALWQLGRAGEAEEALEACHFPQTGPGRSRIGSCGDPEAARRS